MAVRKEINILGNSIEVYSDSLSINELKFLRDNPRVYACTYGEPGFENRTEEEQQQIIYKKLLDEPSVRKLAPDIKRNGGLMEPILVRHDTREVIEGNSRLAVYKQFHEKSGKEEWDHIPCEIVCSLTEEQLAAFLNQIHVKGKTQWAAYEKANFAYARYIKKDWPLKKISELFGESEATIRTRIDVIKLMKENDDSEQSHFSYYDVLVRNSPISKGMKANDGLRSFLLGEIKELKNPEPGDDNNQFTAQELRKKLPVILKKPKVLKKYLGKGIDLDEAFQRAEISNAQQTVRKAHGLLDEVTFQEIKILEQNDFNAFKQEVRKLSKAMIRIENIIKKKALGGQNYNYSVRT
ncbi:MAG: hypothetical protein OXG56_01025 [Gammaproteobacteria bacterium]|nr:hypothetical protein [Gammaproteobacteria bacterium]